MNFVDMCGFGACPEKIFEIEMNHYGCCGKSQKKHKHVGEEYNSPSH